MTDAPPLPTLPPTPAWPPQDAAVADAVAAAMRDGTWGQYDSEHTAALRRQLCEQWNVEHAVLCSSGTIATELALRGLQVAAGEVILAGYDFPGNFRAIEAVGAMPVLVDLAPDRFTIDVSRLDDAASSQTQAMIVSHLHGDLAPMKSIMQWAAAKGIPVVEDTCQSPGGWVDQRAAGSWGDVATLSFGGSKLLTAGRGGAVLTNDAMVAQRITVYSERGNQTFPLSELQAATLPPQLAQLEARNQQRARGLRQLNAGPNADATAPRIALKTLHGAAFRVPIRIAGDRRESTIASLRAAGAPVGEGFRGFFRRRRRAQHAGPLDHAQRAAEETILLHHAALLGDTDYVQALADCLGQALARAGQAM